MLRNWGSFKKYYHEEKGFNSRLQPLQGVVLSEKVKKLSSWNKQRNNVAKKYIEALDEVNNSKIKNKNMNTGDIS